MRKQVFFICVLSAVVILFAGMASAVFGLDLLRGGIISSGDTDVFLAFYHTRGFAAREILAGNFPLWNPHIYSGSPFLADPEIGMLYPLNMVYLILPLPAAINTDVILHMTLLASLTFLWIRRQGHAVAVSFMAGTLAMFSGAYFMHTYAGHLGILSTAAWAPLLLMALDRNADGWRKNWFFTGLFAAGMSFLAGHLQYVIISATAAALYALFLAVERWQARPLWCVLCWYGGGVLLGAAQAFPAVDGLSESYRVELTDSYLASFSFHPENLLTLVAPDFFGNMDTIPYWGKEYLWEQSLFVGVAVLFLVFYGMRDRSGRLLALAAFLVLLVALGVHTPLFAVTSRYVPLLNKLRGYGKFVFGVTILLVPLAARGAARLWEERPSWRTIGLLAMIALLFGGAAYFVGNAYSLEEWRDLMWSTGPGDVRFSWYGNTAIFNDAGFVARAQGLAAVSLYGVAGKTLLLAALVAVVRYRRQAVYAVLCLAVLDLFLFARSYAKTFPEDRLRSPDIEAAYARELGDDRIYGAFAPNRAMTYGVYDVSGYNTKIAPRRYTLFSEELLAPSRWTLFPDGTATGPGRVADILRLRYLNVLDQGGITRYRVTGKPLPRVSLAGEIKVIEREEDILPALLDPSFDPSRTVILEKEPVVKPDPAGVTGMVKVVGGDTDHLVIEAELPAPRILLVTDGYSRHWRATPLEGSAQESYEVMPADYIFRAVPLKAGRHHLVMEYAPLSFTIGAWTALSAWSLFMVGGLFLMLRRRRS